MKNIYKNFIFGVISFFVFSNNSFATAKVLDPINNTTATVVGGKAPNGDAVPLNLDGSGNLLSASVEATTDPYNAKVTITSAGATARTQLASHAATSCFVQAFDDNAGPIYIGGSAVTNVSGTNRGVKVNLGQSSPVVSVSNANKIYLSTDNANDKAVVFCN